MHKGGCHALDSAASRQAGRQAGRQTDRQEKQHATGTHLSGHSGSKLISFLALLIQQVVYTHWPVWPFSFIDLHSHSVSLSLIATLGCNGQHACAAQHAVICTCVSVASAALLGSRLAEWIRLQKLKRHLLASNLSSRWDVAPLTGAQR